MDPKQIIEQLIIPADDFIVGFADLHGMLDSKFEGFHYGISIGKKLNDSIVDSRLKGPTLEYFNHYRQINRELTDLTHKIQTGLTEIGIKALPVEPTIEIGSKGYEQYLQTLSFDISHKMVATRAGLGWIGISKYIAMSSLMPSNAGKNAKNWPDNDLILTKRSVVCVSRSAPSVKNSEIKIISLPIKSTN